MWMFEGRNGNKLYKRILGSILAEGLEVSPRGLKTRELYPVITVIERPTERLLTIPHRNINPFFLVAEGLWILAGRGDAEFITYYNRRLGQYLEAFRYLHEVQGLYLNTENFHYLGDAKLSLSNIENCCCEFSKYMKAKLGVGRPRVLYKPRSGTQGVLGVWFTP